MLAKMASKCIAPMHESAEALHYRYDSRLNFQTKQYKEYVSVIILLEKNSHEGFLHNMLPLSTNTYIQIISN